MRFAYKAVNAAGRRVRGELDAGNLFDLEMRLQRMDLELIVGKPARPAMSFGKRRIRRRDLINFCFHLEQLSAAGVPILEGLGDLRDATKHPFFRQVTAGLVEGIAGGQTLSQAMADHPEVFSRVFVNLIRAGEASGQLPQVLAKLNESLKWEDELASHTKKLLLYPSMLAAVVFAATLFLMLYMVPQLKLFVSNLGQVLPMQTRLLFFLSEQLANYWFVFLAFPLVVSTSLLIIVRHHPPARLHLDGAKLRLPIVGHILSKIILARFANTLAMLYASGLPVLESIGVTRLAVGNLKLQQAMQRVELSIQEGRSVAGAFADTGLFPSLVVRMLHIGESTGRLDTTLLNISYFYDRDVKEAVAKAQTMIGPALTVCLGLMLAWIMLSVISPIYDVISKIKP